MASSGDIEIIISLAIIEEVKRNLINKFHRSDYETKKLISSIASISKLIVPNARIKLVQYLPDNKILEAALEGGVDYIITGDKKHLLPLKKFKGIPIVTANQFIATITS